MAGAQISLLLLFFNILPKQQNILTRQSKLCELLKSVSCVLGRIKILMMHFLEFVCVKMHDFCVNAIPVTVIATASPLFQYIFKLN